MTRWTKLNLKAYVMRDCTIRVTYNGRDYLMADPALDHLRIISSIQPEPVDDPRSLVIIALERKPKPARLKLVKAGTE